MALGVVLTCRLLIPSETETGSLGLLVGIGAGIIGGLAIFSTAAWLLKIPEWQQVWALIRESVNRS
jgi:hypothetical protein